MQDSGQPLRQLAGAFAAIENTLDDYRSEHFDALSDEQRKLIENLADKLADIHDALIAAAIEGTIESLSADVNRIATVTSAAQNTLKHLKKFQEIVKIASAVVELGTAALSGDVGMIAVSIENLAQLLPQEPAPSVNPPQIS